MEDIVIEIDTDELGGIMQKQIFITLEGGLIQDISVTEDLDDVEITVVDFDTDMPCVEELKITPKGEEAYIYDYPVNTIGDGDWEFFEKIRSRKD